MTVVCADLTLKIARVAAIQSCMCNHEGVLEIRAQGPEVDPSIFWVSVQAYSYQGQWLIIRGVVNMVSSSRLRVIMEGSIRPGCVMTLGCEGGELALDI